MKISLTVNIAAYDMMFNLTCALQGQLMFEIRGVAPATDFFYIGETNGNIYVKKAFNTETATTYTVSTTLLIILLLRTQM